MRIEENKERYTQSGLMVPFIISACQPYLVTASDLQGEFVAGAKTMSRSTVEGPEAAWCLWLASSNMGRLIMGAFC